MAQIRVIAHFMHKRESDLVMSVLQNSVLTDAYAVGDIEEELIEGLEREGIIFQRVEKQPNLSILPPVRMSAMNARAFPRQEGTTYYLELSGPLLAEWRQALEENGIVIREATNSFRWVVRIAPEQVERVRALPFVVSLNRRSTSYNMPREVRSNLFNKSMRRELGEISTYDIILEQDASLEDFLAWLAQRQVLVLEAQGYKVRIQLREGDERLTTIANLQDVIVGIEPYEPPTLHNDRARVLIGADEALSVPPAYRFPFDGSGQVIGVADTGLDQQHPDFAGRVTAVIALGRVGITSDPHGHGTHVAGSALGSGTASGGRYCGVAPNATLYFQSLLDHQGKLGGLPFLLHTLYIQAYNAGVRIHNNSWGSVADSRYRINSREIDEFVYAHKDMLLVFSAGNTGTDVDPVVGGRHSAPGFADWLSIGSPATAKNGLTVGASRSDRQTGGYSTLTYGNVWPNQLTTPPIKAERISGDPTAIAGFSSRGPCDDMMIKPDLVAPGTDVLSCRSSSAPPRNFWGTHTNTSYAYLGGTSMAAPFVAGCAAAVRQYYEQHLEHQPSAALLKATLINSTEYLSGSSSFPLDCQFNPNYHQGFGKVYLPLAVPNPQAPGMALSFYDNWTTPAEHFTLSSSGKYRRFTFEVLNDFELRITMAYSDAPGRSLQNNLNLFLELPDGSKTVGNASLPSPLKRPDTANNVEVIRIPNPIAGTYTLQVTATNILYSQDMALVVTGSIVSPLVQI